MDVCMILAARVVVLLFLLPGTSGAATWGYFGDDGPSYWTDVDSRCGGMKQSPIDIVPSRVQEQFYPSFDLTDFDLIPYRDFNLTNNGHSVKLYISDNLKVTGGGLNSEYTALQLHLHWGKNSSVGSEHLVGGKRFPMEMHIVTYKSYYGSLENSLTHDDGVAVLGFFFEIGKETHPGIQNIVASIPRVMAKDAKVAIPAFKIRDLLPFSFPSFFRYSGSLTVPGCYEVVTWTVFTDTIKITETQMAAFRLLQNNEMNDDHNYAMFNNYRPPQNLYGRTVTANFNPQAKPSSHAVLCSSIHLHLLILVVILAIVWGGSF